MAFKKKKLSDDEFVEKFIIKMENEYAHFQRDFMGTEKGLFFPLNEKNTERTKKLINQINEKSKLYQFEIDEKDERGKKRTFIHITKK